MIFFRLKKKKEFWGILGPPYCGIGATIRIGRYMLCLPYAGFFYIQFKKNLLNPLIHSQQLERSDKFHNK